MSTSSDSTWLEPIPFSERVNLPDFPILTSSDGSPRLAGMIGALTRLFGILRNLWHHGRFRLFVGVAALRTEGAGNTCKQSVVVADITVTTEQ
jgi:hypothetical protein